MCADVYVGIDAVEYPDESSYVANGEYSFVTHMIDLVLACLCAGKSDSCFISYYEVCFRISLIRMTLEEKILENIELTDKVRRFVASDTFVNLDPSEKGAVSYFLGMAATNLVAERYFNTPWVMHYDVYKNRYRIPKEKGKKPDLLGLEDTADEVWHVFEAKGSSRGRNTEAIKTGKEQKKQIGSINNHVIRTSNVVQYYFDGDDKEMHICMADPVVEKGEDVKINLKKFFCEYYGLVDGFLTEMSNRFGEETIKTKVYNDCEFDVAYLACLDVCIGLPKRIRRIVKAFENNSEDDVIHNVKEKFSFEPVRRGNMLIGRNGILVCLGKYWSGQSLSKGHVL